MFKRFQLKYVDVHIIQTILSTDPTIYRLNLLRVSEVVLHTA